MANAWSETLEQRANLTELQDAMRAKDPARVRAVWGPLVAEWDDRTFYDFIATADAFSKLTYRHREVFGQVGFGTGGWDSDFTNTMLEILRVVVAGFDDDQRLIVGGAEQLPRRLWTHEPAADEMVHWPASTSIASLHAGQCLSLIHI